MVGLGGAGRGKVDWNCGWREGGLSDTGDVARQGCVYEGRLELD